MSNVAHLSDYRASFLGLDEVRRRLDHDAVEQAICKALAEPDEPDPFPVVHVDLDTIPPPPAPVEPEPFSCWASGERWQVVKQVKRRFFG